MKIEFKATKRVDQGTGASRRLRRAGSIPGIIYGGANEAQAITLDHNELYHLLKKEAFHASILDIDVEGDKQSVLLRDTQWHAYKQQVLHLDFQRVTAGQKIHLSVPLHFINAEISPAVKLSDCIISHVMTEVEVECLPKDLPEFIEVDLKNCAKDTSIHLSELALPNGVTIIQHGEGDPVVATALVVMADTSADSEGEEAEEVAEDKED